MTSDTKGMSSSPLVHELPPGPNLKLDEVVSASRLYLHASSSCRSTGVHGLDVTGFAASDHEAPAHSIANDLAAEQQSLKKATRGRQRPLAWEARCVGVKVFMSLNTTLREERQAGKHSCVIMHNNPRSCARELLVCVPA